MQDEGTGQDVVQPIEWTFRQRLLAVALLLPAIFPAVLLGANARGARMEAEAESSD